MAGKVLSLENVLTPDRLATEIARMWLNWDQMRYVWKQQKEDVRRYIFATSTADTANAQLPWKNKTTIPKLCQIRDNLYANYSASLRPQRKWLVWEANNKDSNSVAKRDAITNYMAWVISHPSFNHELDKIILDYIDYGNCFSTVEWCDERVEQENKTQVGYVGPKLVRISPLDIVMNPTAPSFEQSPKIIRSIISFGELKEQLQRMSLPEEEIEELYNYFKEIRSQTKSFEGDIISQDALYNVDGFHSFREYLQGDQVEVLTFYGDLYDPENDTFYKNHVITVVDRHRLIGKKPNPSFFGYPPIRHCAWRKRQDNLWGMGPLDNLVGLQYRIDHVENMKADIFDLVTFPVINVIGPGVEDFEWTPGAKIYSDTDSKVEMVVPDVQALQANFEIQNLERLMEEMAGAPKEAVGFRTPGEKTKYEVQRLENAASRVFQNKIKQFEEVQEEPALNDMLELARRNLSQAIAIRVFDDEFKSAAFTELTVEDITGIGRIKPIAARHFAEQAELVQNLTTLSGSPLFQLVMPHFSTIQLAKLFEDVFNLHDYELVTPYVALSEQAEAQRQAQTLEEQVMMEQQTASGMGDDFDLPAQPEPETIQPAA